jgi:voltage-gated potassium channel
MPNRFISFLDFAFHFFRYAMFLREAFVGLVSLLLLGGVLISWLENIPLGHAIYFAFITGFSIGYGDISPKTGWGCVVSVGIGMIGMIFVGLTVAVATRALADATKKRENQKI